MIQQPPTRDHMSSEQVKQARDKLGMSQAEFGRALGLSRKTIQAYEYGTLWPSSESEAKITALMQPDAVRREHLRTAIREAITLADDFRHMCPDDSAEYATYERVQIELNVALRSLQ